MSLPLRKIISGGQTGVDRAALDVAIELGIPHGGWCPRGRLAEDGVLDARYQLAETNSPEYAARTERNVIDSDATLIVARGALGGGTLLTERLAQKHWRDCLVVDLDFSADVAAIRQWLIETRVETLNVAGPRESGSPGIYDSTCMLLRSVFGEAD